MRIFLSGNEEAARWHLPIAQSKVNEFVARTAKSGLNQNTFTFLFEDTGTLVSAQYAFGQVSMQVHSPSVITEEEAAEEKVIEPQPKTFYVNTTQGYFWVEVRYVGGTPTVILTPFVATVTAEDGFTEEFVYPGFALNAPGMIAGVFGDSAVNRYVLAQNGGVMTGEGEEKGTIVSTAIIESAARITVVENTADVHEFILMQSSGGQSAELRKVGVSLAEDGVSVTRLYASIDMLLAGESDLLPVMLHPNPCWVHRKCFASYFSPNKTIGYHVDIGSDDDFFGNALEIPGGVQNRLDNTGGLDEALFNHTQDLYRLASILCFPFSITGDTATFALVSPTMVYDDDPTQSKKCWGGYGLLADQAGCADYRQDFSRWVLAPRLVEVTVNFSAGTHSFSDFAIEGPAVVEAVASSWDGSFEGRFIYERSYGCDTAYFDEQGQIQAGASCHWNEECAGSCGGTEDPVGYYGDCPKEWTAYQQWVRYSRENIRNSRRAYFLFGGGDPTPANPAAMRGFYLMFDGLWHLDIGVLWSNTVFVGNSCVICSAPVGGQEPGQNVVFLVFGTDEGWISTHGHEFVQNLEVILPLGVHDVYWPPNGGTINHLSFVAKVPEGLAAPHEPVILTGGVRYPAPEVEGETVECQRSMMSTPCECEGNTLYWDNDNLFRLGTLERIEIGGGCGPYMWQIESGSLQSDEEGTEEYGSTVLTLSQTLYANVDACGDTLTVTDACSRKISITADIVEATISGPEILSPGDTGVFQLNIGSAGVEYSGDLEFVEQSGSVFTLRMPEDACGGSFTVTLSGCGITGTIEVRSTDGEWQQIFGETWNGDPTNWFSFPPSTGEMAFSELGGYVYGTAISGKYKCQDRIQVQGGASEGTGSTYIDAGCPGSSELPTSFCCVNVEDLELSSYGTSRECFPTIWNGPIWNGNYLIYAYTGHFTRTVWEWVCP